MGDERWRIEFLDPHEADPDESARIAWLDAGDAEEAGGAARAGSLGGPALPPRTTARRVFGSLLVFGVALSSTGFAGLDALRHDQAVAAAANMLLLRQVNAGDPVTLTNPAQLVGGPESRQLEPSASVAVEVTNESPDAITLLPGATLFGPGLTAPATLRPSGTTTLAPGQSGRLSGTVTVDCGTQVIRVSALDQSNSVLVQARTASGAVGMATVALVAGGESIRQEICAEQSEGMDTSTHAFSTALATHTHTQTAAAGVVGSLYS